jgi:hypothetical protein
MLINELAKPGVVRDLLVDNYGNFVLQKALLYGTDIQYTFFIKV